MRRVVPFLTHISSRWVLDSVFLQGEFALLKLPSWAPKTIIDIGANVGAFAIWAALHFPEASIVCYEPVRSNFKVLEQNLCRFAKVTMLNCGLFDRDVALPMYFGRNNPGECSIFQGVEQRAESEEVELRRASQKLTRIKIDVSDIVKIDTGGCEVEILEDLSIVLPSVGFVLLEFHSAQDRMTIERRLEPHFLLFGGSIRSTHRGVLRYVNHDLLRRFRPDLLANRR